MAKSKTLVITHDHCALHETRKGMAERPKRLEWVMGALKSLDRDIQRDLNMAPLEIREVKTSEPMLEALSEQLTAFSRSSSGSGRPSLARSASVGYLEEKIIPAVKAVHTRSYIGRLASACVSLTENATEKPSTVAEIDGDTVVSASSLSAALCAVLSCCYAVDACCDAALPYLNAFAVIRPPGHHAGKNGPTVGPERFAEVSTTATHTAKPAKLTRAFSFVHETRPEPCDGLDCSQGFCLLNNAAIAARHALLCYPGRLRKVAIIDIDLHHGNGTEEIVNAWSDVMYAHAHVHAHMCMARVERRHAHAHAHMATCMPTCPHALVHAHMHAHVHACRYVSLHGASDHMHAHVHACRYVSLHGASDPDNSESYFYPETATKLQEEELLVNVHT